MYSLHLTHPKWTHTRSSGQPCYSARGAVGGSVPCSRTPQSWYWRRIPTIPAGPEIRTHNLPLTSPTRYPLSHDCPYLFIFNFLFKNKKICMVESTVIATTLVPLALLDRSQALSLRRAHQIEVCVWTQAVFPWCQGPDFVVDSSKNILPFPKGQIIRFAVYW